MIEKDILQTFHSRRGHFIPFGKPGAFMTVKLDNLLVGHLISPMFLAELSGWP